MFERPIGVNPDASKFAVSVVLVDPTTGLAATTATTSIRTTLEATNRSGSVTTGGTSQVLMAANASRQSFSVQNTGSYPLYVKVNAAAVADNTSLLIPAGGYFESPNRTVLAVNIIGPITGQTFFAQEW